MWNVDDMLVTFPSTKWRDWFEESMKPFELVKQYDYVSYLGIQITREKNGDIILNQKGYIETMIKRHGFEKLINDQPLNRLHKQKKKKNK